MTRLFFLLILTGLLFASCVPTKDLIYLQDKQQPGIEQAVNAIPSKPYRLQTNDILNITLKAIDQRLVEMFRAAENAQALNSEQSLYSQGYSVDDHGNIRIPVLGEVNVLGYTLEETRAKIEELLLRDYFKNEVDLFVNVKLAGFRYTINGEVAAPGSKLLFQDKVNIMEAIANAGDITITGDRKSVVVMRQFPSGTEMHTIDLTDSKSMQSPYYHLQPNDYIYVKPLPQKSWGTGTTGVQSLTTIISVLTLVTTTLLILTR
ncbi:MAG: polysaccharide biosynthesis/export family protein [Flavobacterium sp.]|nr:polysaccharide biosynthesis/export family protein [Flavobacterium sp.]